MSKAGEFAASAEDGGWRAKAADIEAIASARHADPFAILGPHLTRAGWAIRAFAPDVVAVRAVTRDGAPRWVTAEPEFLPPREEPADKGKEYRLQKTSHDEDFGDIQILPARRGQYRR